MEPAKDKNKTLEKRFGLPLSIWEIGNDSKPYLDILISNFNLPFEEIKKYFLFVVNISVFLWMRCGERI